MKYFKLFLSFLISSLFLIQLPSTNVQYTEYVALISQNGVNAPVATVLQNNLGFTPTYTYNGVGQYNLRAPSGYYFDDHKTAVWTGDSLLMEVEVNHNNDRTIYLYSSDDSIIYLQTIYIRVYK